MRTVTCRIFTGDRMQVVVPEIVGDELCRQGYIEPDLTRVLLGTLRPGMVFVDVGAHYGYHSLVAGRAVGPSGRVLALEPGRGVLPLLLANTAGHGNITVDAVAASARTGTALLRDYGAGNSALSTIHGGARVPPDERRSLRAETYEVPAVALDDHLPARGIRPDFVKLDAEGAELDILRGMERILDEVAPILALEVGDYDGMASPSTASSLDHLDRFGYRAYEWSAGGLRPHVRRTRYGYGNLFLAKGDRRIEHVPGDQQILVRDMDGAVPEPDAVGHPVHPEVAHRFRSPPDDRARHGHDHPVDEPAPQQ
ncbi:MAG TPA: FkbM family methyltransferase [Acidimicrobiia bacterium]|nr:FkbM family methyltransferase [Acidimicrobiia bacterium]